MGKQVSYLFIVGCFVLIVANKSYSILNIEGNFGYIYMDSILITPTPPASNYFYGGAIGVDLSRITPSLMLQMRISVNYSDFSSVHPRALPLMNTFIGTRFIFGSDNIPYWLSIYLDTGMAFATSPVIKGINLVAINLAVGTGLEFFLWEGLYLGVSVHVYFIGINYLIVGSVIGYRIR